MMNILDFESVYFVAISAEVRKFFAVFLVQMLNHHVVNHSILPLIRQQILLRYAYVHICIYFEFIPTRISATRASATRASDRVPELTTHVQTIISR